MCWTNLNKINQLLPPDYLQRLTQANYNNKDFKVIMDVLHVCIVYSGSQTSFRKILQSISEIYLNKTKQYLLRFIYL